MSDIKFSKEESDERQRESAEIYASLAVSHAQLITNGKAWERVTREPGFDTDRLRVNGGWLYRVMCTRYGADASATICFVPEPFIQFEGDNPKDSNGNE